MTRLLLRWYVLLAAFAALAPVGGSRDAVAAGPPVLLGLGPAYAWAGAPEFTLSAWGYNFEANTVVRWNGNPLTTTFHHAGDVSATVPAALVANPGTHTVTLETPGQGTSAGITFEVRAEPPEDTHLEFSGPGNMATSSNIYFMAQGGPFVPGISFTIGGVDIPYRIVSETTVLVGPYVAPGTPGPVNFVFNDGVSNTLSARQIMAPVANLPSIGSIGPTVVRAGGPGFWLSVDHNGQVQGGSVIEVAGQPLTTYQQDGHRLLAHVPASLIASLASLEVRTRSPGGNLTPAVMLAVTATGSTATPSIQEYSGTFLRASGRPLFLHLQANNRGPNAYVTWNGTPLWTIPISSFGVRVAIPPSVSAVPGNAPLVLINPPPISTMSTAHNFWLYSRSDVNCDKAVDAVDVTSLLLYLVGLPHTAPQFCFPADTNGDFSINVADAVNIRREVAGLQQ